MRVLLQLLVFGLLLTAGQFGVHRLFPNPSPTNLTKEMWGTFRADLIFLGDSVNRVACKTDRDRSAVSAMVQRKLGAAMATVSRGGLDLAVFRDYGHYLVACSETPKTVFVTVNLAVLAGDSRTPHTTHRNIGFELRRLREPLRDAFMRPMYVFRFPEVRPEIRMEEFLKQEVRWEKELIGRMADLDSRNPRFNTVTDQSTKEHLVVRYFRPLTRDNVKLAAMKELAATLKASGSRPVFFITPVNHEFGERYFPGQFRKAIAAKAEAVKAVGARTGAEVLDLSFLLGDDCFAREKYPSEHLNERGRDALAQRLADHFRGGGTP